MNEDEETPLTMSRSLGARLVQAYAGAGQGFRHLRRERRLSYTIVQFHGAQSHGLLTLSTLCGRSSDERLYRTKGISELLAAGSHLSALT